MTDASTKKMLGLFEDHRAPSMFLAPLFRSPRKNFHNSETVEIDIVRNSEFVATTVLDGNGYPIRTLDNATNKEFTPPVVKDAMVMRSKDLISRQPGVSPYADQSFQAKATARAVPMVREMSESFRRHIELQAAQVLQTGKVELRNAKGEIEFVLDYGMNSDHLPTAATSWDDPAADIQGDIEGVLDAMRDNGLVDGNRLIMGIKSWNALLKNTALKESLDNRRINQGALHPMREDARGGQFRGTVDIGAYAIDIYTYNGKYDKNTSGTITKERYVSDDSCIVLSNETVLDATFGAVPSFGADRRALSMLPGNIRPGSDINLTLNAWFDNPMETLTVGAACRPLLIPTGIDTFGCINTGVA